MCANCHVVSIATEIKDLQALTNACKRLGWTFRKGQSTYNWYGQWMDDSPVPRHLFATEAEYQKVVAMDRLHRQTYMNQLLGKCHHAIQVPDAHYEIGIIKQGDKYVPIWDWYCTGGLNPILGQSGGPLVQAYAVEKTKLEAQRQGHICLEKLQSDGSVQLQIQLGDI